MVVSHTGPGVRPPEFKSWCPITSCVTFSEFLNPLRASVTSSVKGDNNQGCQDYCINEIEYVKLLDGTSTIGHPIHAPCLML